MPSQHSFYILWLPIALLSTLIAHVPSEGVLKVLAPPSSLPGTPAVSTTLVTNVVLSNWDLVILLPPQKCFNSSPLPTGQILIPKNGLQELLDMAFLIPDRIPHSYLLSHQSFRKNLTEHLLGARLQAQ